jgi:hypothetical protein
MTIHEEIIAALTPVLDNSWAVQLPPDPVWPAIVFDVDSAPEPGWTSAGEGYDQHSVTVTMLAETIEEFEALAANVRTALEAVPSYMYEEDYGDGEYEPDPQIFMKYIVFRHRTRRG